jgi:hypothetical protein
MRWKYALIAAGVLVTVVATSPFLIFWYTEAERARLIAEYEMPSAFLNEIVTKREGRMSSIMRGNEVIVCAIGGYGSVESLPELNVQQKNSLPKEKLPSEGLTWYLLFFTQDAISRVYLVGTYELAARVDDNGPQCIGREGAFSFLLEENGGGDYEKVLNLSKGVP